MQEITTGDSSVVNATTVKLNAEPLDASPPATKKESAARAALAARAGRTLTDLEWDRARERLLEFVSILRAWHQEVTPTGFEVGKAA